MSSRGNDGDARPRRGTMEVARELAAIFGRRADESADEDRFVADNFALLKASGLVEAGVPAELGGGGADVDELADMLRTLGYHCGSTALAFSMHSHQVAIAAWRWTASKGHCRRAAAEADRPRAHPARDERRIRLDRGLRPGREGRGRLPDHGAQAVRLGGARRRPADDRRHPRRRGRSGGPAFRHPDELAAGQGARQLAHARHARHRFARRADRGPVRARGQRRRPTQGRRMGPAVPHHRHHRLPAGLFGLSRRGGERARYRHRPGQAEAAGRPCRRAGRPDGHGAHGRPPRAANRCWPRCAATRRRPTRSTR